MGVLHGKRALPVLRGASLASFCSLECFLPLPALSGAGGSNGGGRAGRAAPRKGVRGWGSPAAVARHGTVGKGWFAGQVPGSPGFPKEGRDGVTALSARHRGGWPGLLRGWGGCRELLGLPWGQLGRGTPCRRILQMLKVWVAPKAAGSHLCPPATSSCSPGGRGHLPRGSAASRRCPAPAWHREGFASSGAGICPPGISVMAQPCPPAAGSAQAPCELRARADGRPATL